MTPIEYLEDYFEDGNRLYVKRDDLLPFSYGGNKVRIAREFVADMYRKGKDSLIFYGDRRSNLCRVLANICFIEKIPALMIATGEHVTSSREPFNSCLIRSFKVPVIDCEKNQIAGAVDEAMRRLEAEGRRPYYIYGNRLGQGNEGVAARAYAGAYGEIKAYEKEKGETFDLIAVPYGTGATLSGLIAGSLEKGDKRDILGISISSRTYERAFGLLRDGIEAYFRDRKKENPEYRLPDADTESVIQLETAYNKGGYGLYDQDVEAVIDRCLKAYGMPLDPTYTAKALWGLGRYLKDHEIRDKKVLFIHTGGLPLHFDYLAEKG